MTEPDRQICTHCIMDASDPEIVFDDQGVCCHCHHYAYRAAHDLHLDDAGRKRLELFVKQVQDDGRGKDYDCLIGVSGGVDSSMVAYHVKRLGLRPLAVHLDNGWDAELAVCNVERLLKTLDIDLYTYVLDWEEFKDIHLSFLKASVANSEIPTDHAIIAILYKLAATKGIRYIISGGNIVTEAIMPDSWMYDPKDWRHIKAIHRRFGKVPLKTFPRLRLFDWAYNTFVRRVMFFPILNYIAYDKEASIQTLEREVGWKRYPAKHFESIYTRFFQAYILVKKFGIDKRRAHYSTLINSGQMTREEALAEIVKPPYPSPELERQDYEYIIKKFGLTEREFEEIMNSPVKNFSEYPNNFFWFQKLNFIVKYAKKIATFN